MTTTYDTIIVGGGLAGLTAATRLAQAGQRPLVLERNSELGGRARTDDLDGWLFNHGAHALYRNAIGHRTLQDLGVEPLGEDPPLAGAQLMIDGTATPLPIDGKGIALTKALSVAGKVQFAKFMLGINKLDPAAYANVTVDEWLADYRPDVQAVVKAVVRLSTYAAATNILSADAAIAQLAGNTDGVMYVHGGWKTLIRDLGAAAEQAGATIRTSSAVEKITHTEAGFTVACDGASFTSPTLILAAGGPTLSARMLGIDESEFGDVGPAPEAATLDLALDAMPTKHRFVLGVDNPTYFSVHSPPARLAPEGAVSAVVMRYIAPDDDGSADEHRASLEAVAELAGCPTPVRSRFLRRMTVTNGLPIASAGGLNGRPSVSVDSVPGAFLAGDWVGARGLLADAAIASGDEAATAAMRVIPATASAH